MLKEFKRPLYYLAKKKWVFAVGVLLLLIVDIMQLYIPKVVKEILNDLYIFDDSRMLYYLGVILALSLGMALCRFFWRHLIVRTSFHIEEMLRNDLYSHYLTLDKKFYDKNATGELISLATNDLQSIRMVFGMGVVGSFDGIFLTVLSVVFMMSMNVELALFVLIPLPVITIFLMIFGKKIYLGFYHVQESFAKITARLQEYVGGIMLIKNYGLEEYTSGKVREGSLDLFNKNMNLAKIWGALSPLMLFVTGFAGALVVILGGPMTVLGDVSIGEFVAFTSYIGILSWPMMAIGWVMNLFERGKASMERINAMLDSTPELADGMLDTLLINKTRPLVELRDLTFSYAGAREPALKNINLEIGHSRRIGITGKTGSGKSTLVSLLGRMYDPDSGSIFFAGREYNEYTLAALRDHISLVPQQNLLFSATIRENLAFGRQSISNEELGEIIETSGLLDTIASFDKKEETILGERGVNLSGGQKQRVAIGRAIAKGADLLIFDDSFSAVDAETEKKILANIEKLDMSVVIITHRVSSIARCDVIHVMDQGQIIESGSHDELLELDGLYADMYRKQKLETMVEK